MIVFSHGGDDAQHLERDPVQDDVGQGEQVKQPQECNGEAQEDPQPVIETLTESVFFFHKIKLLTINFISVYLLEILP